jgi:membrane protease YdiL (CAAX protease family)
LGRVKKVQLKPELGLWLTYLPNSVLIFFYLEDVFMNANLDMRRIILFLALAFGIAWAASLAIYLTGGLQKSPVLVPGTPFTLAFLLLLLPVMWAPAIAHILTRVITREGWQNTGLRPNFRDGWKYWLAAWFLPGILTILGGVIFFLLFPPYFDANLGTLKKMMEQSGQSLPVEPWVIVVAQTFQAMLISPIINSLATFGEEFGWRSYLQNKLMPLGGRKMMVVMGIIWGVWHWPVIFMGYNYGTSYPGYPFLGALMMVWFCFVVGTLLGWATLRGGSVWPAVIGHAAVNGIAGLATFFLQGQPPSVVGPLPLGIIGSLGFTVVAVLILVSLRDRPVVLQANIE